jgi:glycerophosphoryl diester phosphodiesterase
MTETKIYGHRGCMGTYPENTLLGFRQAIELGADGIELDVHMTKDGEIVVIHDEILDRTTDGAGYVKDHTLKELKQFSAGVNYAHFPNYDKVTWDLERVPTLQEVLELLGSNHIDLNIELKTCQCKYVNIEDKVLSLVNEYGNSRKVVYSSFHLPTILQIKKIDQNAEIAWLLDQQIAHPKDYLQDLELEALHLSKQVVFSGVPYYKDLFEKIRIWTVNDMDGMKQLLDLGVNAIITDYPGKALFYRSERKSFV